MISNHQTTLEPEENAPDPFGRSMRVAIWVGFACLILLLMFAAFAPLSGGAIAKGTISPEGSRRVVQHLEGGIIEIIHHRDGAFVEAGEPLITLDELKDRSSRNISLAELKTLEIIEARLIAEKSESQVLSLSFSINPNEVELLSFKTEQEALLNETLQLWESRRGLFRERRAQSQNEIESLKNAINSYRQQSEIISEEIIGAEILLDKALYAKPRFLALQREKTRLDGMAASTASQVSGLNRQVTEIDIQMIELEAERRSLISQQLADTRAELKRVRETLRVTEDVLFRTTITAPISGQIVDSQFKTVGGVIRPGERILDIVPIDEKLQIQANVLPNDIDIIRTGQSAKLTFSALSSSLPQFEGRVLRILRDTQDDPRTGTKYYKAEIEVDLNALSAAGIVDKIVPGMPVDVIIETERRTLMSYLVEPFKETFRKGMRETNNHS